MRYFNPYGIGDNRKGIYSSIMKKFLEAIQNGDVPVVYGDGTQSRDFVYVEDIAETTIRVMGRGRPGEVYNVGTGSQRHSMTW